MDTNLSKLAFRQLLCTDDSRLFSAVSSYASRDPEKASRRRASELGRRWWLRRKESLDQVPILKAKMAASREMDVTIDFGTNLSRYTFYDPKQDFYPVFEFRTAILFTPDKKFHSFGPEAEDKFQEISHRIEDKNKWYFFEEFKMKIHEAKDLTQETELCDHTKRKSLPALVVFSAGIRFLKDHALQTLRTGGLCTDESSVKWTVLVPGFWEDKARSFMREAAQEAGIPAERYQPFLEIEAVAIKFLRENQGTPFALEGTQFVVGDFGGGKTETAAFEVQPGGTLKQIRPCVGSCVGGNDANKAFEQFILDVVGVQTMEVITDIEMRALKEEFERAKRLQGNADKVSIGIPAGIKDAMKEAISTNMSLHNKITIDANTLTMSNTLFRSFLKAPMNEASMKITEASRPVKNEPSRGTSGQPAANRETSPFEGTVFGAAWNLASSVLGPDSPFGNPGRSSLNRTKEKTEDKNDSKPITISCSSGGLCESSYVKDAIKKENPGIDMKFAPNPSTGALHGAAACGSAGAYLITARMYSYTYGINALVPFKESEHDPRRRVVLDDGPKCKDCFHVHICCDKEIKTNTRLPPQIYSPAQADQTAADIVIYRSPRKDPKYVDEEDCEKIGSFKVPMPDTRGGTQRKIKAALEIGGTELTLHASNETTGERFPPQPFRLP